MQSFKQWLGTSDDLQEATMSLQQFKSLMYPMQPDLQKLLEKKLAQIKALNMKEDADDICGIYPPEYEGIGNYPPAYFGNSNPYIKDSLKLAKKGKKKRKKKKKDD